MKQNSSVDPHLLHPSLGLAQTSLEKKNLFIILCKLLMYLSVLQKKH